MLLPLTSLKPSPFNPKKPLTKKQLAALKKNIDTFDFKRSLCVCKDFTGGDGYLVLDGNTALDILKEIGKVEVDCHIVEKVVDKKSLVKFMAGYSINKTPLYSEFAIELDAIDFPDFTGLNFSQYSFDIKIDDIDIPNEHDEHDEQSQAKKSAGERQTQFFLTLPPDCIDKLRNFIKTKAYNANKTEAISQKIDAMNDIQFLENILQIIL
ncbi:MAG: hypothetical protein LBD20_02540 [Spirochaetaceae bacterium]|jgi:hypothetical protein|nr:hypothetical protein [Spirochaetaceae bacterium]